MATKVTGIKGINISKSSVLKDGSKKSGANAGTRDTSNGTTRDNSKSQSALDAASIKMLLGQTELLAKKAAQIEQQMKISAKREEERIRKEEQREIEKAKREEEREKLKAEQKNKEINKKIGDAYDKTDAGVVNGLLAGILGPGAVMLGKGINAAGLGGLTKKGAVAGIRGVGKAVGSIGKIWGRKSKEDKSGDGSKDDGESENALSVNKREMAAEPTNKLRTAVTKRLDTIIRLLGGKKAAGGEGSGDKKSWLDKLLPFLPLLAGILSGYGPLIDFGVKYMMKRLRKIFDPIIKGVVKLAGKLWSKIKGPVTKIATKIGSHLKNVLGKGGKILSGAFKKVGSKIMASGIGRALKKVATKITESGIVKGLSKLASGIKNTASKITSKAVEVGSKILKPVAKMGSKLLSPIKKVGGKILSKVAGKGGMKALGKSLLKKIPGVGLLTGLYYGGKRALQGDWTGAGLELLSGAASLVPGVGTAASIGVDALLLARDVKRDLDAEKAASTAPQITSEGAYATEVPTNSDIEYMQESADKQNAILDILSQIEYNLRPEVQQHLDEKYLSNAQRMFTPVPTVSQFPYGEYTPVSYDSNVLGGQ